MDNVLLKIIAALRYLAMGLFRITVRKSNYETSCIHVASGHKIN